MFYKILYVLLILQHFSSIETRTNRFDVEFHNVTCKSFTTRVKRVEFSFQKFATNSFGLSGRLMMDRAMGKEVDVRIRLHVMPRNGRKSLNFLDVKLNLCDTLAKAFNNVLLKRIMDEFRRSSNAPYACPLKANFLYKLDNYTISEKSFPPYVPYLNFTYTLEYYENVQLLGNFVVIGAVVPRSN